MFRDPQRGVARLRNSHSGSHMKPSSANRGRKIYLIWDRKLGCRGSPAQETGPPDSCCDALLEPTESSATGPHTYPLVVYMCQDSSHQLHQEDDQQQAEILGASRRMVTLGIRGPL